MSRRRVLMILGAFVALLGLSALVAAGLSSVMNRLTAPSVSGLTKDQAVSIALATVENGDLPPGLPRTGWRATYAEAEPGREFVLHYPGNHLIQRAPCMRLFDLSYFPCSDAPVWYVHLETPNGQDSAEVVVDSALKTGRIVQMGSGGMKPLPPAITPFPTPSTTGAS